MKLLFITHSSAFAGGAEDDFTRLCEYFGNFENISIDILAPQGKRFQAYTGYAADVGCYEWGFVPVVYSGLFEYFKYFLKYFIQIYQIRKFVGKKKYDLCILNVSVLLWPLIYLKIKKFRTLVFIRETVEPKKLRKFFYYYLSKLGTYFIAVSKSIENDFRKSAKCGNIETLYSSVENPAKYTFDAIQNNDTALPDKLIKSIAARSDTRFISVGQIGRRKNQILILEALLEIRKRNIKLPVVYFVGNFTDGSQYSADFFEIIEANDLTSNCVLLGELQRSDYLYILRSMDALLITSRSEGMPLIVADSFGLGIPVVSTKVGGIPEVVKDNYNGYLIECDKKELFDAMMNFMDNTSSNPDLKNNAISSYSEFFDLKRNMDRLKEIVQKLTSDHLNEKNLNC